MRFMFRYKLYITNTFCSNKCNQPINLVMKGKKGEGEGHPRTGHKNTEGEQRYSSTLALTSALGVVGG
jgi:hypothetical protein